MLHSCSSNDKKDEHEQCTKNTGTDSEYSASESESIENEKYEIKNVKHIRSVCSGIYV